jgi:hypothetical protein
MREIYRIGVPDLALEWVQEFAATLTDRVYCPEIRRLDRCLPGGHPRSRRGTAHARRTALWKSPLTDSRSAPSGSR